MKRGMFNKLYPNHYDFGKSLRKPFGESSFQRLIRQYKANAKRRKLNFSLTEKQIKKITSFKCFYCGIEPMQKMENKEANGAYIYNGIDRKNPLKGYTKQNCVPCCKICNRAKSNLSYNKWVEYLKRIKTYNDEKGKNE